jgi:glucose-1-phosphate thymidylyltransferase
VKGVIVIEDPGPRGSQPRSGGLDALERVANRPIAHHVFDALESAGVDELIVASSTERATEVRECLEPKEQPGGPELRYVTRRTPLDIDGALGLAAPLVDGSPCVLHYGSGLLGEPLDLLLGRMPGAWPDVVLVMHQGDMAAAHAHLRLATPSSSPVSRLDEEGIGLGVAGVCLFGADGLARASIRAGRDSSDTGLKNVADRLVDDGASFDVLRVNGWRQYMGDPLDLLELNRIALDRLEPGPLQPYNHGNRIEGRVQIHQDAYVRGSVIVGPTVIGPGAHISDAYIGPYTAIGARAVVEGAEIERSIVDVGASITHVGDRLVSSVVGRDARVFRDFSLPRALRLRVGEGAQVALC